ncbi:hypothetical protein [Pontibacter harenae]|uniref:hypothetical protein n=1 Tax=Pontibacter harenae TaxID=2894083 RepID=UPI001E2FC6DC|nr:hypothetical protein [Pontibacter harenae]MCC9168781.1 hypothetical protein [Pontibacter harenae]
MRHEEHNHRPRHPRDERFNVRPRNSREENFNDFKSRWDEPVPLHRNREPRFYDDRGRFNYEPGQHGMEDWRPNEPRQQYRRGPQHPEFRHHEADFNQTNQHADDRWSQDDLMPHPNRYRHYNGDDRRNRRGNR